MSAQPFTREDWQKVSEDLGGVASRWWTEHRDVLVDLSRAEVEDLARSLRHGDVAEAKLELVARMSPDEWVAYRDGTTEALRDLARRRAAVLDALEELGRRVAVILGRVLATVLGLPPR